jgi:hypothetical protein
MTAKPVEIGPVSLIEAFTKGDVPTVSRNPILSLSELDDPHLKMPPRVVRNSAIDRKAMRKWLDAKLYAYENAIIRITMGGDSGDFETSSKWFAIAMANCGDIGPLRRWDPDLADFLHLPKRSGKGKSFPKTPVYHWYKAWSDPKIQSKTRAVWDAGRIRMIWKETYNPLPVGYESPEEIAAKRWGVAEDAVARWKKSERCPKDPWKFPRVSVYFESKAPRITTDGKRRRTVRANKGLKDST